MEPFVAARAISVAASLAVMVFLWVVVARWLGGGAAFCSLLLLAASPAFTRYAHSAGTDLLAVALGAAALWALVGTPGRPRAGLAGLLGALSALTRYSGLHLLPAGLAALAVVPLVGLRRGHALARFALGFVVPLAVWSAISLANGVPPARHLVGKYAFYAVEDASRNYQDTPESDAAGEPDLPANLAGVWTGRLVAHAAGDVARLLGPAMAALALLGFLSQVRGPGRGLVMTLALAGTAAYLALVTSFYSERYRLALIPIGAALAGSLAAAPWLARAGPLARRLGIAVLVAVAGLRGVQDVQAQRAVLAQLPYDVLEVAPRLAAAEPRGAPVMSRKGHIGYHTGREVVAFPRVGDLPSLAARAREGGAAFLYVSWYEAQLRPEFAWLLDTTASAPGLTMVAASACPPAVAYRIGPEFGRDPEWWPDPIARRVHEARGRLTFAADSAAAIEHAFLAANAMAGNSVEEAETHARAALAIREDLDVAWSALGWAHGRQGREREAVEAFQRSWLLHAGGAVAEEGLQRIAARLDARLASGTGSAADRELRERIRALGFECEGTTYR